MSLIRQPIQLADCSESIGIVQHHEIATMRLRLRGAREVRLRLRGARVSLDFLFFTVT